MLQARFLLIVVLLVWFGILNASAQVDSGRIVPRNKWPVDAHPVNNPTPWIPLNRARTIRYGVVLGDTARAQVFAAGIDLADQPTGNAIPSDTDFTSPGPLLDPKAHVQWAANTFGRRLPSGARARLAALYLGAMDSAKVITSAPARTAAQREAVAIHLSRLVARTLLQERDLFSQDTAAQRERFGRLLSPTVTDTTRMIQAIRAAIFHDLRGAKFLGAPVTPPPPRSINNHLERFDSMRAESSVMRRGTGIPTLHCTSTDTITTLRVIHNWTPTGRFAARVYLATHPAFQWAIDALASLGVDTDWMYHSSIGGSIWMLERRHVIATETERTCSAGVVTARAAVKVDSATDFQWYNTGWFVANGASGSYLANDHLTLIHEAQFSDWMSAYKYLQTPTPNPGTGHYYPIRAVSYSVGDYGFDWICQTSANAFTWRRWSVIAISSPTGAWLYGQMGRQGISSRNDPFFPAPGHIGVQKGCVPGARCHYQNPTCAPGVQCPFPTPTLQPPVHATGLYESQLDGHGYNLDMFWNPNKNDWRYTEAPNSSVPPPWPSGNTEGAGSLAGWR